MSSSKYDIFISYRRKTSFDTANLIAEKLRHAGYRVFFDVDTLSSGKFNEQLLTVIQNCKDFILVLPEKALDRCTDPNDWIRREVSCAMQHHKNIIPVMLAGFEWPEPMPEGMEELPNYQAITSAGHEYFDMAVERLKSYLQSTPSRLSRNALTWGITAAAVLAVGIGILSFVGYRAARSVCTDIASQMSSNMATLDLLGDVNNDLAENVHQFFDHCQAASEEDLADYEKNLTRTLDKTEKETARYLKNFPPPQFNISTLQSIILRFHGLKKEEIEAFPIYYQSLFDDMQDACDNLRLIMAEQSYSKATLTMLNAGFSYFQHSLNGFYYAYIQMLSNMPKDCRKTHYQLSGKWKNYPSGVPFDLADEEYDNFQLQELTKMEAEMQKVNAVTNYEEQQLDQMNDELEQLEQRAKALEEAASPQ